MEKTVAFSLLLRYRGYSNQGDPEGSMFGD